MRTVKSALLQISILIMLLITTIRSDRGLYAQESGQPPERPGELQRPTMPERPDQPVPPTPPISVTPDTGTADSDEIGAWIELQAMQSDEIYWTEVEWIGGNGIWHKVDSWTGHTTHGRIRWFVRPTEFGKGAFRWQIYNLSDKRLVASSQDFYLPRKQFETVIVEID